MSSEITDSPRRNFLPAAGRDLFLPLYDPLVNLLGFDRTRQDMISQANLESGQRILDIGCGTGSFLVLLKRRYQGVQAAGIDPDPKALRRAKMKAERAGVSVQLDRGFADELPHQDASFDYVFSSFMFHHLDEQDREKTLKEAVRVLKPGGAFYLLDFEMQDGSHGFLHRLIHSHARLKDNTPEQLLELMHRAGFGSAERFNESSMLFGLLQTAYYRAAVSG